MPHAKIGECEIHYENHGQGEPLVMITGLGGDLRSWKSMVPALSKHHHLIVLDNRGSGRSTVPKRSFIVADMADDVAGLLDHLGICRSHVLGASMGGNVAQEFAMRYPERVGGLVLLATYARRPDRSSVAIDVMVRMVREGASIELLDTMMQCWCLPDPMFRSKHLEKMPTRRDLDQEERDFINGFALQKEALDAFDNRNELGRIKAPTLIMHGNADIMVDPRHALELGSGIKGARTVLVDGVGHIFPPGKCVDEIISFLVQHPI
jgi:3-oxoadipate enol-lactonase